jgi:adenosylmethionine-8-amino-7-oxononanoate aminotransferase
MLNINSYSKRDADSIWHPFTQHFNTPEFPVIIKAKDHFLYLENNQTLIDGISSWWVNLHGHSHPAIIAKISETMNELQQVMFAGFTHPYAVQLSERILGLFHDNFDKVFFSDNGSTSVEVALKMCAQYWSNQDQPQRKKIICFENSYHGDTFGAMSVNQRGIFNEPFWPFLFEVHPISPNNPQELNKLIECYPNQIAGMIYEPLIQGAGGMLLQDKTKLELILETAKKEKILLIADEVMTGFGRTGKLFATHHLKTQPDIICLSKGLTGGFLPLGLTLSTKVIYEGFLSGDKRKTLFHGHSFTGNALSCSAALASLDLLLDSKCQNQIQNISDQHLNFSHFLIELQKKNSQLIKEIRQLGTILVIEFNDDEQAGYLNQISVQMKEFFFKRGILLRPLGNVLYVLPPLCIDKSALNLIYQAIEEFINHLRKK